MLPLLTTTTKKAIPKTMWDLHSGSNQHVTMGTWIKNTLWSIAKIVGNQANMYAIHINIWFIFVFNIYIYTYDFQRMCCLEPVNIILVIIWIYGCLDIGTLLLLTLQCFQLRSVMMKVECTEPVISLFFLPPVLMQSHFKSWGLTITSNKTRLYDWMCLLINYWGVVLMWFF